MMNFTILPYEFSLEGENIEFLTFSRSGRP